MVIWQAGEDEVGQGKSPSRVGASVCALAVFFIIVDLSWKEKHEDETWRGSRSVSTLSFLKVGVHRQGRGEGKEKGSVEPVRVAAWWDRGNTEYGVRKPGFSPGSATG